VADSDDQVIASAALLENMDVLLRARHIDVDGSCDSAVMA